MMKEKHITLTLIGWIMAGNRETIMAIWVRRVDYRDKGIKFN